MASPASIKSQAVEKRSIRHTGNGGDHLILFAWDAPSARAEPDFRIR